MKKSISTLLFAFTLITLSAQNWTPMAAGLLPNGRTIYGISAIGDNVIWAVASDEYFQGPIPNSHHPKILRSSDGGLTWVVKDVEEAAGTISFQIVAEDSLAAWITTQDYGTGAGRALYQTFDGGDHWTKKLNSDAGGVALNRFNDGKHWLAHNRQGIAKSSDFGGSWQTAILTGYLTDEFQILYSGANMSCTVGDTLWNGTSSGRILRFTNFGESSQFISTTLGTATTITSIAFQDSKKGLCYSRNIANNNRIARSLDGGATWAVLPQQPGNTIGWNIAAIPGAPGYYALCSHSEFPSGKVSITKNAGDSWTTSNIGTCLNAIQFSNPTTGWIGSGKINAQTEPAIYKYNGAALVDVNTPEGTLSDFTVTPNPASDIVQFSFEGSETGNPARITLSDQRGQVVLTTENSNNQLKIGHLPVGVYFLKVETRQGWAVRKIVRQ